MTEIGRTSGRVQQRQQSQDGDGYTVRGGDTMSGIARRLGLSLQELVAANPQIPDPNRINPGQQLNVPGTPAAETPSTPGGRTHTFQKGDALGRIAKEHGLTLDQLMSANPEIRDERRVREGTEIRIPDASEVQSNPRVGGPDARAGARGRLGETGADRRNLEERIPRTEPAGDTRPSTNGSAIDPRNLEGTGASARTARQDGLGAGVEGSRGMARNDEGRVRRYQEDFRAAGARHNIDPSILAAIASRESRGGNALDRNGLGDGGNGFGLMQVDRRYHSPAGGPYSREHIDQAAGILAGFRDQIARNNPSWSPEQVMRGAISAYNRGTRNMSDPANTDRGTTGGDYANDVIVRAQYYKERGF